jgi:uncharacterized protein YhhL (DUF1145 family)
MNINSHNAILKRQLAAIILMAAGWGWICGNFVQPVTYTFGIVADILHVLPLVALLLLSMAFFLTSNTLPQTVTPSKGARMGISILAIFSILTLVAFIILGVINPDPNSVGVHSFEDWMTVVVLGAGSLLWFVALVPMRSGTRTIAQKHNVNV